MTQTIAHRGPDAFGYWNDAERRVFFGHRRLSIIDISPLGAQPMTSSDGRYITIYNGEIYNFPELRRELEKRGVTFRGTSDTEILLEWMAAEGLEATLGVLNGMFAMAVWDTVDRVLHLARDRFGEKPLYYGWAGGYFLFGSELKALKAHPAFRPEIDHSALTQFMRFGYVPAPHSIYQGISKLPPAHYLTVRLTNGRAEPVTRPYYSARESCGKALHHPIDGSDESVIKELEALLTEAVGMRMQSDVPLGAFLSGGVDSSIIVSLMQAQSPRPVKTFSIGVDDDQFDEAKYAKQVARHLGTEHTELYVKSEDARAVIPLIPELYDEPFADSSQIPTYLVSKLASREVKVSLSGDAGDELFGGYNRYLWSENIWKVIDRSPRWALGLGRMAMGAASPATWDRLFHGADGWLPRRLRAKQPGSKIHKLKHLLGARSQQDVYLSLVSQMQAPDRIVRDAPTFPTAHSQLDRLSEFTSFRNKMMFVDLTTYLPDDILVKVDRASMGVSLEARVPFLDPRVVELAWRIPMSLKIRDGKTKWILRQILYRHVPEALIERPKMGFSIPMDSWLRGPLHSWAESLLSPKRIEREGLLEAEAVQTMWRQHESGGYNHQASLWNLLVFQMWKERWLPGAA